MTGTDKHLQLLNAAAACFARYGYKKTTVDEIVQEAGISKGLFYHYYTGKRPLYLRLYDTYTQLLQTALREQANRREPDLIERLKQISRVKLGFMEQYPALWDFLFAAYYEDHPDVAPTIRERNAALVQAGMDGSGAGIDWSRLRPGVSPQEAVQLVTWLADGFVRQYSREGRPLDQTAFARFDACLDLLRTGLYRPEGGNADAVL